MQRDEDMMKVAKDIGMAVEIPFRRMISISVIRCQSPTARSETSWYNSSALPSATSPSERSERGISRTGTDVVLAVVGLLFVNECLCLFGKKLLI